MEIEEVLVDEREEEMEEEDVVVVTVEGEKKGKTKTKKKTRVIKPNKDTKECIKIISGSSNAIFANDHAFKDPYFLCRDAICPKNDGSNLFMFLS